MENERGDGVVDFRYARLVLAVSMLVMGGCGIIYEYVLGLLGNNMMGSSHEQIFVVIGVMMFAMGMGATFQTRLKGDLIVWFLCLEILLGLLGGLSGPAIYTIYLYSLSYEIALYLFAFVIGCLIGLEIPVLIRINEKYAESLKANLSDILCMDYVGSLVGALLFTFVLLRVMSVVQIGFVLGAVNIGLGLLGAVYFRGLIGGKRKAIFVGGVVGLGVMWCGYFGVDGYMADVEQKVYADPIVFRETTRYQHLVMTKRGDETRLYINGHIQFSSKDEHIYHEQLVHPAMKMTSYLEDSELLEGEKRKGRRVLILGGGDGLALREVLKYRDVAEVVLVDLDPGMIALGKSNKVLREMNGGAFEDARVFSSVGDGIGEGIEEVVTNEGVLNKIGMTRDFYDVAKVKVYTVDAQVFVDGLRGKGAGGGFDVILLDFPDPKAAELAKLYSVRFYRKLRGLLSSGGMMAVQSTSPYRAKDVFLCIGKTLREAGFGVLGYQDYVPSFGGDWGWHLAWGSGVNEAEMLRRVKGVKGFDVETRYLTGAVMGGSFDFGKGMLEGDVGVNRVLEPRVLGYYLEGFR